MPTANKTTTIHTNMRDSIRIYGRVCVQYHVCREFELKFILNTISNSLLFVSMQFQ